MKKKRLSATWKCPSQEQTQIGKHQVEKMLSTKALKLQNAVMTQDAGKEGLTKITKESRENE